MVQIARKKWYEKLDVWDFLLFFLLILGLIGMIVFGGVDQAIFEISSQIVTGIILGAVILRITNKARM
ncbi:MAG: hypothetical protein ACE5RP_00215 [Nitrosopumilus sp.]